MIKTSQRSGAAALIAIVLISAFALAIMVSASLTANIGQGSVASAKSGEQTFAAADSGIRDALYRLGANAATTSYVTNVNGINVAVTISGGFTHTVTSVAHDPASNTTRTVRISLKTSSFGGGFIYAAQAGPGGIIMDSNSFITGSIVTSNGNVTQGTGNGQYINGETTITGSNAITGVDVTGAGHGLHAHTIQNSNIAGDAFYTSVAGTVKANSGGTPETCTGTTGTHCHPGTADSPSQPFPLSSGDIAQFEAAIPGSNVINGNQNINADQTLGAAAPCNAAPYNCKINGNVTINKALWTIKSHIVWITGNLNLQQPQSNQNCIILDPALGSTSTIFIVDGTITVPNKCSISGSGDPKSFVFMVSTKNDPTNTVISASNNADAAVFFAANGIINVGNNTALKNATGYQIHLNNGSSITYDGGLAGAIIPTNSSPTPPVIDPTSWQEL